MTSRDFLSEKWIKAAILGTIWAASEIVLGSFLHNLRVPFSGNILTAIALILLISVGFIWKEKGIYWRAGLICALMKTMSPSAVIFGPMIAIFTESLLLELSVRILGRNFLGFSVGGMMAMSWNLFQKVFNYIIFYGMNIVGVYRDLLNYARKQLNIESDLFWMPLIILLFLYAIFGLLSAWIGINFGKKVAQGNHAAHHNFPGTQSEQVIRENKETFSYSITWLILNIIILGFALFSVGKMKWFISAPIVTAVILVWAIRYKRALRQISRPRFWIFFVLITMVTAFIFSSSDHASGGIAAGLVTGLQMNLRAALIITGFAVLGSELYNPVIRAYFLRTSFRELPAALELAFESLPGMIKNIPDFRILVKNPENVIAGFIQLAEQKLTEIKARTEFTPKVFIVTGSVGEGKSKILTELAEMLRRMNIAVAGIISEKISDSDKTVGYNLTDIKTGRMEGFLRSGGSGQGTESIGRFTILPTGLSFGREVLMIENCIDSSFVIIDEVGKLELNGKGWATSVTNLIDRGNSDLIISVRDSFLNDVIQNWDITPECVFRAAETDADSIYRRIIDKGHKAGL